MTKVLNYIEVEFDRCSLVYGTAPCTASIPTTGSIKCHNSLGTCQDRVNFATTTQTLRFCMPADYRPTDIEAWPDIASIAFSPGILSLGKDLGTRSSIKVTFEDHPWADTGPLYDKYLADRAYDPWGQGTFWGKIRSRNPFVRGRALRWVQGLEGQTLSEMETRHFLIESFDGPDDAGRFTIVAKDALKLADGDRAQAPMLSPGRLNANINNSTTSATLAPTGIGDTDYPASGYLNIGGKEIVSFTRSGDALTIARGQFNTEAVVHTAGDRMQLCLYYAAEDPADIIEDLLTTYAGVDSALIPIAGWQAETDAFYRRVNTRLIAEPTAVKTLVAELIEQCGLAVWWDDLGQEIKLQVLRAISTDAELYNDQNIVDGSLRIREQPEKRISRVWTRFGQFNPLKSVDDDDNYRSSAVTADLDAEADYGQPAIKEIFAPWIPFGGLTAANRVNDIQLGRFLTAPRHFTWQVYRWGSATPVVGEGVQIESWLLQDATGARETVPVQIIRVEPRDDVYVIEAEEMRFVNIDTEDLDTRTIIIDASAFNLNLRSLHDALFPPLDGGEIVNLVVNANVVIGSTSTSTLAFDVGTWPTTSVTGNRTSGSPIISGIASTSDLAPGMYVTGTGIPAQTKILSVDSGTQITLNKNASSGAGTSTVLTVQTVILNGTLNGRIQGKGGRGGDGGYASVAGTDGEDGGDALYSRAFMDWTMGVDAEIWGGGGGGGGGRAKPLFFTYRGAGGGGAAGTQSGAGGVFRAGEYGDATNGWPGTATTGGAGGTDPGDAALNGGDGGDPGQDGEDGDTPGTGAYNGGFGGDAGVAIDGVSYLAITGTPDVLGSQIN